MLTFRWTQEFSLWKWWTLQYLSQNKPHPDDDIVLMSKVLGINNMYQHGNFLSFFNNDTKKLVHEYERIQLKISRQNLSKLFNETCVNICVCVCVCVLASWCSLSFTIRKTLWWGITVKQWLTDRTIRPLGIFRFSLGTQMWGLVSYN